MIRMARRLVSAAFASAFLVFAVASTAEPRAADLTGKWQFTVTTPNGSGTPTVTFQQKGDSLTGHYSSQLLGERDFNGKVTGQKFTFTFGTEVQGTSLTVKFDGTVESDGSVKGSVDFGGQLSGTFVGKRS
jgi:hypothetical protein